MTQGQQAVRWGGWDAVLSGAHLRSRVIAGFGAMIGICAAGVLTALFAGDATHMPLLAAPLGASAVLVFVLPASPIAQPWPVIGGNTISALVGVAVAQSVHDPALAPGLAVGLAIVAMSLARALHPPGGGMALTTVIGGSSIAAHSFAFALAPACLNSVLLVLVATLFHFCRGHSYPHTARPTAAKSELFHAEDVDAALRDLGETFDISRADLDQLLLGIEANARRRAGGGP